MEYAVVTFLALGWLLFGVAVMVALAFRHNWKSAEKNYLDFKITTAALLQRNAVIGISPDQIQNLAALISGAIKDQKTNWVN